MKLSIVAVGQRMPDWAQTAYDDYAKRFPPDSRVELKTVKIKTLVVGKPPAKKAAAGKTTAARKSPARKSSS